MLLSSWFASEGILGNCLLVCIRCFGDETSWIEIGVVFGRKPRVMMPLPDCKLHACTYNILYQ